MAESTSAEGHLSMLETALMLGFCLLAGFISLLVVAWLAVAGRILTLDGLTLSLICLTLSAFFAFPVFLSYRNGELRAVLNHYLKRSSRPPVGQLTDAAPEAKKAEEKESPAE
jgi:hypothetical protein